MIVADKLTPLRPEQAATALASAYGQLTGVAPASAVLGLLLAQSALETGNWQKIHNFNFGNQKASAAYPLIVQFRCSEIIDGVERFYDPPAPECNFRAYETSASGALDYLRVLHAQPHWWQGLHTGDPSAFVDALATPPKYFTASPALYKSVLISRLEQYRPLAAGALEQQAQRPTPTPRGQAVRWPFRSALACLPSDYLLQPSRGRAGEDSRARARLAWREARWLLSHARGGRAA